MSDQPLTERVQDVPTMRQRVGGFFLNYVVPPVVAAGVVLTLVGAPFYLISIYMRQQDVAYCHGRIPGDWTSEARVDPASIQGPRTKKSCAELLRRDEEYQGHRVLSTP